MSAFQALTIHPQPSLAPLNVTFLGRSFPGNHIQNCNFLTPWNTPYPSSLFHFFPIVFNTFQYTMHFIYLFYPLSVFHHQNACFVRVRILSVLLIAVFSEVSSAWHQVSAQQFFVEFMKYIRMKELIKWMKAKSEVLGKTRWAEK